MFINHKFTDNSSISSVIRECIFSSVVQSWNLVRMMTFPFNTEIVLSSTFVHVLTNEEKDFLKKKRR